MQIKVPVMPQLNLKNVKMSTLLWCLMFFFIFVSGFFAQINLYWMAFSTLIISVVLLFIAINVTSEGR